jgi:hypothetical protein
MNQTSSRSHSIFTVVVECASSSPPSDAGSGAQEKQQPSGHGQGQQQQQHIRVGKLNLVDLAGAWSMYCVNSDKPWKQASIHMNACTCLHARTYTSIQGASDRARRAPQGNASRRPPRSTSPSLPSATSSPRSSTAARSTCPTATPSSPASSSACLCLCLCHCCGCLILSLATFDEEALMHCTALHCIALLARPDRDSLGGNTKTVMCANCGERSIGVDGYINMKVARHHRIHLYTTTPFRPRGLQLRRDAFHAALRQPRQEHQGGYARLTTTLSTS